jgi:DNA-binding response OmpR family regulator
MVETHTLRDVLVEPWQSERFPDREPVAAERPLQVLVVEGDEGYTRSLADGLSRCGYEVVMATTGEYALKTFHTVDLVLLGMTLPDIDGVAVCRIIRATDDIPIIALSALDTESERILALRAGMDDCLPKPSGDVRELIARIEAVMRRIRPQRRRVAATLVRGSLYINPTTREVWIGTRLVEVTRKEFELLYRLAERAGAVVSRQQLMQEIWGYPEFATSYRAASRTIDTHVNTLRRKLGSSDWIRTVRGVGFRFDTVNSVKETS